MPRPSARTARASSPPAMTGPARLWDTPAANRSACPCSIKARLLPRAFSPDGKSVATAAMYDRTARLWDAASGKPLSLHLQHQDRVGAASFSPDGKSVVTASRDKTARLWDAATGKPLGLPLRHKAKFCRVLQPGRQDASSPPARTRPPGCGTPPPANRSACPCSINSRFMSRPSARTASASSPPAVTRPSGCGTAPPANRSASPCSIEDPMFVSRPSARTARVSSPQATGPPSCGTAPPANRRPALAASSRGCCRVLQPGRQERRHRELHDGAVVGHRDRQTVRPVLGAPRPGCCRVLQPGRQGIVTVSQDKTARIWDSDSRKPIGPPLQHQGPVVAASFSPDGKSVITASGSTAQLWDRQRQTARPALAASRPGCCRVLQPGRQERRHRQR